MRRSGTSRQPGRRVPRLGGDGDRVRGAAGPQGVGPGGADDVLAVGEQQVEPGAGRGGGDLGDHGRRRRRGASRRRGAGAGPAPTAAPRRSGRRGSSGPSRAGRTPAGRATPGQPLTRPLWLNSQRPSVNGAQAPSPTGMPAVALRTAARTAPERTPAATSGSEASVHIGTAAAVAPGLAAGLARRVPADAEPVGVDGAASAHVARRVGLAQQASAVGRARSSARLTGGPR